MLSAVKQNNGNGKNGKWLKFFRKYHKWLSVFLTVFILLFVFSGVILNHRDLLSPYDVDRSYLLERYEYKNWNSAAVKSFVRLNKDSALVYGNIGIWLTTDNYKTFQDFNSGFPTGTDNQKIESLLLTTKGNLYAGTLFGLYFFNNEVQQWSKIELPIHENRIVGLLEKDDSFFVMSRSKLLVSKDNPKKLSFKTIKLLQPENYDDKIGLFKTLWVIHSGEIYGMAGKLIVDFVGLVFGFLTITGIIYWLIPKTIKKRKKKNKKVPYLAKKNRWVIRWHNKLGYWLIIVLVLNTITGMFLRPPLLISIADVKVEKIPYTELDDPNPWFDKLRKIYFDKNFNRFILIASDGVYYSDDEFQSEIKKYENQPVLSVMGVNVFEFRKKGTYLIGSFSGLFKWTPETGEIIDYIDKKLYEAPKTMGPPIGEYSVTGYIKDFDNQEFYFDFNKGAVAIKSNSFTEMPSEIKNQAMSWWNVALEVHTGRYYRFMFGPLYILFIPLAGLSLLFILISGLIVYRKRYRNNGNGKINRK
ncbi:MAG: PepSY domain-containing protein [Bacteroidota bacterium]